MREYDPYKPLIHIHLPKTGGVTVKEIYKNWFKQGLLFHYYNEPEQKLPVKYDLEKLHNINSPICVFGHFNKARDFGIKDYYPDVNQFITILRDPFEKAISGYFFLKKNKHIWKDQSIIPKTDLSEYLRGFKAKGAMFNHFPTEVTMENYKEIIETQFIEVGVLEHLQESMQRIASKLNVKFDSSMIKTLNTTKRDQIIPYEFKQEFIENNPLDFAVYDYVLSQYT